MVNNAISLESAWEGLSLYWKIYITENLQTLPLVWTSKEFYSEMSISLGIVPIFRLPSWPDGVLAGHLNRNAGGEILEQDCLIIIKMTDLPQLLKYT